MGGAVNSESQVENCHRKKGHLARKAGHEMESKMFNFLLQACNTNNNQISCCCFLLNLCLHFFSLVQLS